MRTSETTKAIIQAMLEAQTRIPSVAKAGFNKTQNYAFASYEHYEAAMTPILAEVGLVLTASVVDIRPDTRGTTSKGNPVAGVYVKITLRATHSQSGEWIEIDAYGEGVDSGDKAVYKAITGARKYASAMLFKMVTTDDPEGDESHDRDQRAQPKASTPTAGNRMDDLI